MVVKEYFFYSAQRFHSLILREPCDAGNQIQASSAKFLFQSFELFPGFCHDYI